MAPYPRYVAGALRSAGVKQIIYMTIDDVRRGLKIPACDMAVFIGGVTVPGKYLGGVPATPQEMEQIAAEIDSFKIIAGPVARHGFGMKGGTHPKTVREDLFDVLVRGDVEGVVYELALGEDDVDPDMRVARKDIGEWAVSGASIVTQHQDYPNTMAEIQTYRGCLWRKCSFCTDALYGAPDYRPWRDIVAEVRALYNAGIRHFRLGSQPDLFAYCAEDGKPNVEAIRKLYRGIRKVAPDLRVLHMDNANPKFISSFPEECREIAKIIIKHHTPGDVAALGGETADPTVVKKNNLCAMPEDILASIRLLNEVGSARSNGMPELLPGLNFVFGLIGETKKTYELNYEFLQDILDEGLMLRRINLRQVAPARGTKMFHVGDKIIRSHRTLFTAYKRRIRRDIDRPMLRRVFPRGCILSDVRAEATRGNLTLGRQIASYPILVGISTPVEIGKLYDVVIYDHGYRSISGVPIPLNVNTAPLKILSMLPEIGSARAGRIAVIRPLQGVGDLKRCLDDAKVAERVSKWISF